MIDIENQVYTPIATALRVRFPGISVSGEYTNTPTHFPFVSIVEIDNRISSSHMDTSDTERYAVVTYEINVYSDKTPGKKSQCRDIIRAVDALLYERNFRRLSSAPIPNLENASIYRIVARYRAATDGDKIYRR